MGTHLTVKCPTCRERFEIALDDSGAMWGREFKYTWPSPPERRWLPRARAMLRLLVPKHPLVVLYAAAAVTQAAELWIHLRTQQSWVADAVVGVMCVASAISYLPKRKS